MSFCKYRDKPKRRYNYGCPYGCSQNETICHKWAKDCCRYQQYDRCKFGVHVWRRGFAGSGTDETEQPQAKRRRSESERTPETPETRAVDALTELLERTEHTEEQLKMLYVRFHPDKVINTPFEIVFLKIAQKINEKRDNIRAGQS